MFACIFFRAYKILDPDFGWHLKVGETIIKSGIPVSDPFSYTMATFPFIDHEWLTNVLIYQSFEKIGFLGISLVITLIFLATLVFIFRRKENYYLTLYLIFAFVGLLFPYFAVRPQVISWFLFALFIKLLFENNKKQINLNRILLVVLSIVWVNLHGSFAILVVLYAMYIFGRTIRLRKFSIADLFLFFILIFSTFLNPYGVNIWREIFMQITDSKLRYTIVEWTPLIFRFDWNFILYFSFFVSFLYKYRKKILLEEILVSLFLLVQALMSQRHLPLFVISSIPIFYQAFQLFNEEIQKKKESQLRLKNIAKYLKVFVFVYGLIVLIGMAVDLKTAGQKLSYPTDAVNYLNNQIIDGNVLSEYSWGGYLIWKMPAKKVFIDGRMPSWRWSGNSNNEEANAMDSYIKIFKTDNYNYYLDKYSIDWIFLSTGRLNGKMSNSQFISKIESFVCGIWSISECRESTSFVEKIKNDGWREVYRDGVAVIYKRDIIWDK